MLFTVRMIIRKVPEEPPALGTLGRFHPSCSCQAKAPEKEASRFKTIISARSIPIKCCWYECGHTSVPVADLYRRDLDQRYHTFWRNYMSMEGFILFCPCMLPSL